MLRHAVTLTFDPSILNIYSVSAEACSNSAPKFSESEQSLAVLGPLRFKCVQFGRRQTSWICIGFSQFLSLRDP